MVFYNKLYDKINSAAARREWIFPYLYRCPKSKEVRVEIHFSMSKKKIH